MGHNKKYEHLQKFIDDTCKKLGVEKKIFVHNNLHDVPEEYRELHMLINAMKDVKYAYETQNKDMMKAFSHFSYEHRKGRLSWPDFLNKFKQYRERNTPSLILS